MAKAKNMDGTRRSIDEIAAPENITLAEIMAAERRMLATLPPHIQDEYHKQGREIKRRLENMMLYGNEEGINE